MDQVPVQAAIAEMGTDITVNSVPSVETHGATRWRRRVRMAKVVRKARTPSAFLLPEWQTREPEVVMLQATVVIPPLIGDIATPAVATLVPLPPRPQQAGPMRKLIQALSFPFRQVGRVLAD
jgi:hypothetical protein